MAPLDQTKLPAIPHTVEPLARFDPNETHVYQARMSKAPRWFCSLIASNGREKNRVRAELSKIKGAIPLLMKPRNGDQWTMQDRNDLRLMLRSASAVVPYLVLWALPGSMLLLPFLAWHLDARRKNRERKKNQA
jgi:hypothetical protein